MQIRILLLGSLMSLAACAYTVPVAVIGQDGRVLTGSATASMSGSHFQATDGKLTCSGGYDGTNTSVTITMPVVCNDGRKGFVVSHRDNTGMAGNGTVTLNDGYKAEFVFGPAAKSF